MVLSLVILGKSLNKSKNQKRRSAEIFSYFMETSDSDIALQKKMIIMEESTWKKRRQKISQSIQL